MKKHLLALVSLLLGVFSLSWAQLPEFSTPDAPIYYHIFFTNGGSYYVVDKGAGQQIVTAASAGEGGKWAFIGTGADDGSFYLLSALGNYVKTGDRLTTISSQSSAPPSRTTPSPRRSATTSSAAAPCTPKKAPSTSPLPARSTSSTDKSITQRTLFQNVLQSI